MTHRTLDRILQSQGFGTRKECLTLIRRRLVTVGGELIKNPRATFPLDGLVVEVGGVVWQCRAQVYLALHKPTGYECSRKPSHHPSVMTLLPAHLVARGVQAVGRLDHDASGLLLLTDDGAFNHAVSSPRRHVTKTYRVTTRDPATQELTNTLLGGVQLHGESQPSVALACRLVDTHELELTIDQGKYHQVKRMLAAAGNRCVTLHRIAIGNVDLSDLGLDDSEWCELSEHQLASLRPR